MQWLVGGLVIAKIINFATQFKLLVRHFICVVVLHVKIIQEYNQPE